MTNIEPSDSYGVSPVIDCFGDSLTALAIYTQQIRNGLPGRIVNNQGIAGQTAAQIACRQGGKTIFVTLTGNAFNGTNQVNITPSTQFLSTPADNTTRTAFGTVNGIACYITRSATGSAPSQVETYTIRPLFTSAASIPANSVFIPDSATNAAKNIQILWMGRNDVPNLSQIPDLIDSCVAYIKRPRRVIVPGILMSVTETNGSAALNAIIAANNTLRSAYPNNYVEATPPTDAEFARIGYTKTAQDAIEIANGVWPASMRSDFLHLNDMGSQIKVNRIVDKYKQLDF